MKILGKGGEKWGKLQKNALKRAKEDGKTR